MGSGNKSAPVTKISRSLIIILSCVVCLTHFTLACGSMRIHARVQSCINWLTDWSFVVAIGYTLY
jgi:hypothetical protein